MGGSFTGGTEPESAERSAHNARYSAYIPKNLLDPSACKAVTLQTTGRIAFGMGVLSLLAVVVAILALQDIYHGEADLILEWMVVRLSFVVITIFHVLALIAVWMASRLAVDREPR
jgi:hypothetical protein